MPKLHRTKSQSKNSNGDLDGIRDEYYQVKQKCVSIYDRSDDINPPSLPPESPANAINIPCIYSNILNNGDYCYRYLFQSIETTFWVIRSKGKIQVLMMMMVQEYKARGCCDKVSKKDQQHTCFFVDSSKCWCKSVCCRVRNERGNDVLHSPPPPPPLCHQEKRIYLTLLLVLLINRDINSVVRKKLQWNRNAYCIAWWYYWLLDQSNRGMTLSQSSSTSSGNTVIVPYRTVWWNMNSKQDWSLGEDIEKN